MNPFGGEFWNSVGKLGPWPFVAVVLIMILGGLAYLLLRQIVKMNDATTKERISTVADFIAFIEKKAADDVEMQKAFMESGIATVKAMNNVATAVENLCGESKTSGTAIAATLGAISSAIETNQRAVMSMIDTVQREHRACLEMTSAACSAARSGIGIKRSRKKGGTGG